MAVVYVSEQGAVLTRRKGLLRVMSGQTQLRQIPFEGIERIVLMGNVQLTPHTRRHLMKAGCDVVFTSLAGRYLGRMTSGVSGRVTLRRAQFDRLGDAAWSLDFARAIVRAKIQNQRRLLQRSQRSGRDDAVAHALIRMRHALEGLAKATTMDEVRGFEGACAAMYFGVFNALIKQEGMTFTRRIRRPPPDPVNILLSFGYMKLTHLMHSACEVVGVDPFLGALHATKDSRPSLALDLIEPFRPLIIDSAVLSVLNRRSITWADFEPAERVEDTEIEDAWLAENEDAYDEERPRANLRRSGLAKWVSALNRRFSERVYYPPLEQKVRYQRLLEEEVRTFGRALESGETFEPFMGPR